MSRQYTTLCRVNVKPLQNTATHKKIFNTKNMAAFVNLPRKITLLNLKLVCWLPCLHSLNWQLQQLRLCYDKGQIPKHHRRIFLLSTRASHCVQTLL